MEQDEAFGIGMDSEYKNVRFGLFAAEEITAADGNAIPENGFIAEVSLDENMKAVITEKIPFAKYYVQEIATDEHYILNGEKYLVSFEYQGQEMTTVYVGKYFLKETVAPDGFILDENVYPFSIENDGETIEISNTEVGKGFINKPKKGAVEITKTDVSTGELIPNCGIEILDKDGNAVVQGRTDENGVVTFEKLRTGDYFYREFDAPDGYILDENSYPFTIKEDGEIVKCQMTNTKIPQQTTPYTGDNGSNLLAWIMIGLSLAIGSVLVIRRKKKVFMEGEQNEE